MKQHGKPRDAAAAVGFRRKGWIRAELPRRRHNDGGQRVSYSLVRSIESIGTSHAITSGPSIGAQNILIMGLESRTTGMGNILPNNILAALHSGSRQQAENGTGGNDTNTLIPLHIFAGGHKAAGFSIPRDDWVNFAGLVGPQQTGKIDQAYGVSMYYREGQLWQSPAELSQDQIAFGGTRPDSRPSRRPRSVIPATGAQGGAVHSRNGIPCVS